HWSPMPICTLSRIPPNSASRQQKSPVPLVMPATPGSLLILHPPNVLFVVVRRPHHLLCLVIIRRVAAGKEAIVLTRIPTRRITADHLQHDDEPLRPRRQRSHPRIRHTLPPIGSPNTPQPTGPCKHSARGYPSCPLHYTGEMSFMGGVFCVRTW